MPARTSAASSRSSSARSSRATPPPRRRKGGRDWSIDGEILRWVLALAMQMLGVTLLIGLTVPNGKLTDWELAMVAPWFGTARWLLPPVLIVLGYYLERVQGDHWDWQLTLVGSGLAYVSLLGLLGLIDAHPSGGKIGAALAHFMSPLVTVPGTIAILCVFMSAGILLALDMSLPAVMAPLGNLFSRRPVPVRRPRRRGWIARRRASRTLRRSIRAASVMSACRRSRWPFPIPGPLH